nr:uncharacterized protein zmp:0000000991 [Nerophis lumbriciformis]
MPISDTRHLELTVGGETLREAQVTTTRSENGLENLRLQLCCCRAVTQEGTPSAQVITADRQRQVVDHSSGPRYTPCVLLRLSNNLDLNKSELRLKRKKDLCLHGSDESQRRNTFGCSSQVIGPTPLPDTSRNVTRDFPLPEKKTFLVKQDQEILVVCHEARSICQLQQRLSGYSELEQTLKDQGNVEEQSDPSGAMLSSAMVTVLAPNWTGRLRRSKRFESTGSLETLANLQGGEDSLSQDHTQKDVESVYNISQAPSRVPFQCTRQNSRSWSAKSWSAKSGPPNMDYDSKNKVFCTTELDIKETVDNKAEARMTMDANPQNRNLQAGPQVRHSSMSSKPTTSSLLLSLRRLNSQKGKSNPSPAPSEVPLKSDQNAKLFSTHLSHSFAKPGQELFMSLPSLSISSRPPESHPVGSSLLSNHHARGKTSFLSTVPINKVTNDTPFAKPPPTMNRTQPSDSLLSRRASERAHNWRGSGRNLNLLSDSPVSAPRLPHFDSNTPLASSSRWKKTGQQGSSTPVLTDTSSIQNMPNTPLIPICNNNCDPAASILTNSLNRQISHNSSNSPAESVCNGNLLRKPPRGVTQSGKEKYSDDTIDKVKLAKLLLESRLKKMQPQKSPCFPDGPTSLPSNGSLNEHRSELSSRPSENQNNQCSLRVNATHRSPQHQNSPLLDTTSTFKSQVDTSESGRGPQNDHQNHQYACPSVQSTIKTTSFHGSTSQPSTTTPFFGFVRSYSPNPKAFRPKSMPCLIPAENNCSPESIAPSNANPTCQRAPLPTPKPFATPSCPSMIDTDPKSLKVGGILTTHTERERKYVSLPGHGKRVKHVMWEDCENSEPSDSPAPSPLPRSMSQRPIRSPSIFSFLRSSSQNTKNTPLCTTSSKSSNPQVGKEGKYHSSSSDSTDQVSKEEGHSNQSKQRLDPAVIVSRDRLVPVSQRLQSSVSLQAVSVLSTGPSPPPDLSSGYKIRYSPPPYSTLISNRGETKKTTPRSPLFQNFDSNYRPNHELHSHPVADAALPMSKPIPPPRKLSKCSPLQNEISSHEISFSSVSLTDDTNNNCKNISRNQQNCPEYRFRVIPQSLHDEKYQSTNIDSSCLGSENTRVEPLQCLSKMASEQSHETESHSNHSSSGSSSTDSRSVNDEVCNKRVKESLMGKFKLFSSESNNKQSPKRRRFVKKSISTPNSRSLMSESEKANKTNRKMDQVLNKLKQTFSTRRSEDDPSFPWKWRRASETLSFSEPSGTSDATIESNITLEQDQKKIMMKDNKRTKDGEEHEQNRHTIIPTLSVQNSMTEDKFFIWPNQSSPKANQDKLQCMSHQFDVQPTNQYLPCPDRSPSPSHTTKFRKSTSSPKSPFSPLSSLSPLLPYSSPDVVDDSVFYSPKLQNRMESLSPGEPREGISLASSRKSQVSTGRPSGGPMQSKEQLTSCYADLKYGIEPGRSFSVSSVLSSRSSRPGRISTGPRFMSVGDLSEPESTYGGADEDLNSWLSIKSNRRPKSNYLMQYYFLSEAGKDRSRSLPRSLTSRLAQWSSGVPVCPPAASTASKSPHLWGDMNTSHFDWDLVSPPTPPLTPPLSPHTRRMSKPPSVSSPNFPSPPLEPLDNLSPRGHLPSRGYISSLSSTFEESSDSNSDTTTDDEYYLEESEDGEKETEF